MRAGGFFAQRRRLAQVLYAVVMLLWLAFELELGVSRDRGELKETSAAAPDKISGAGGVDGFTRRRDCP